MPTACAELASGPSAGSRKPMSAVPTFGKRNTCDAANVDEFVVGVVPPLPQAASRTSSTSNTLSNANTVLKRRDCPRELSFRTIYLAFFNQKLASRKGTAKVRSLAHHCTTFITYDTSFGCINREPGHPQGECPYDTRPGVYRRDIPLAGVLGVQNSLNPHLHIWLYPCISLAL